MATTTNFGWTTPDDTALVKDGAAAIRTLGSAIDTSLGGAWTSWTPTFTNLVLGNGTIDCKYKQVGKTVVGRVFVKLGSTSSITGIITLSMPVNIINTGNGSDPGFGRILDDSTGVGYRSFADNSSGTNNFRLFCDTVSATYQTLAGTSATTPMTWATNDFFSFGFQYEAA